MRLSASSGATIDLDQVDLADPSLYSDGDPHAVWRILRDRDPVRWQSVPGRGGFWSVTRYADSRRVMLDHRTFSSTGGVFLNLLGQGEPAQGQQFASADPPRHTQMRSPVQHRMTAAAFAPHLEATRDAVGEMLADGLDGRPFDLAAALAPLPMVALGPLLGIPRADWPQLMRLVMMSVAEEDPDYRLPEGAQATLDRARRELFAYLIDLLLAQVRRPQDNVISALRTVVVDGRPLRPGSIVANVYSILLGAAAAIPHVPVAALLEPATTRHFRECGEDPDAVGPLVEEALRWSAPAQHFMRIATRPTTLGPANVLAGQAVVVWLGSANRDGRAFERASEFDSRRTPNHHLAFGFGRHYCVGNNIARLVLREVFRAVFDRFSGVEPAGDVEHIRSTWLAGFKRAPVVATPRRAGR
ncbi:cytochrome P450 [Dactylosporangium matsuzakiense]|uniref:Cytochrome P450 n=1 Tax=Dactylosporangium matsuzakiense TaxID=53360 RepID=A0A9W6KHG7_9ACTN|nr:cytochrome P450 [Dactylosporangium matsuzakiense]GLL02147.1 cytochrome P450 [Dactylosporangium matsuzakiense]